MAGVPAILEALKRSTTSELQATLILALGRQGTAAAKAVPILMRFLDDSDSTLVLLAAGALGRMGQDASPALPRLEAMARSGLGPTREAAKAAQRIRSRPEGFPPLVRQYGQPLLFWGGSPGLQLHQRIEWATR